MKLSESTHRQSFIDEFREKCSGSEYVAENRGIDTMHV